MKDFELLIVGIAAVILSILIVTSIHQIKDSSSTIGFSESPRVIGQFNNCDIVRFVANGDSRPGYVMDCSKDRLSQRPVMN